VKDEVLREAGYMCGNPCCHRILTLELHHIVWVRDRGGNEPLNLLALCPNCHSLHTSGRIPDSAIRHWKGMLHALNHAFNKEANDLLLYLHKTESSRILYSGDGLLRFAALVSAGFVEIEGITHGLGQRAEAIGFFSAKSTAGPPMVPITPPSTSGTVRLSEKGRQLVESWLAGDEDAYRRGLEDKP
jgi:hypothetical protein